MSHHLSFSRALGTVVAVLAIGGTSAASAAVTFTGTSEIDLTLVSITSEGSLDGFTMTLVSDGLVGDSGLGDGTASASSDAASTNLDPLGLGVGFDVSLNAAVNGEAGLFPGSQGLAEATADQIALISLDNQSANDVTVVFDFSYSVDAATTTANTNPLEDAFVFAEAEFSLNADSLFLAAAASDLTTGIGESLSALEMVTVQIAAGSFADVELFTIAGGFAVSEVPVFGALPLFMTGLAGLSFFRRRNVL